jgi:uracil-DNA glycosylase
MPTILASLSRRVVGCRRCPQLRAYCARIARERKPLYAAEVYWGKPVPAFGDPRARLMLVGLAPGAHGSNRTGRMFTGDASGDFLYPALYRAGFASQPQSTHRGDGMLLRDCMITAAARCAPPKNRPTPQELRNCFPFLVAEFDALPRLRVCVGLGKIGYDATVHVLRERGFSFEPAPRFGHCSETAARKGRRIVHVLGSYHPSRQNTNTGKLTASMFDAIFERANLLLDR